MTIIIDNTESDETNVAFNSLPASTGERILSYAKVQYPEVVIAGIQIPIYQPFVMCSANITNSEER